MCIKTERNWFARYSYRELVEKEYLTEHLFYKQKDEFEIFIEEQRKRLNEQLKNVKPLKIYS